MTDRERADALWDRMAEMGWVDSRGSAEYERISATTHYEEFENVVANIWALANMPALDPAASSDLSD